MSWREDREQALDIIALVRSRICQPFDDDSLRLILENYPTRDELVNLIASTSSLVVACVRNILDNFTSLLEYNAEYLEAIPSVEEYLGNFIEAIVSMDDDEMENYDATS